MRMCNQKGGYFFSRVPKSANGLNVAGAFAAVDPLPADAVPASR